MTLEINDSSAAEGQFSSETEDGMSFAEMLAEQDSESGRIRLEQGQRVTVRIVAITGDTIFVNTGSKIDGIVERQEMEVDGELPYQVGDSLDLYVISVRPQEVRLSRVMSGDASLASLEDARDKRLPVEGRVTGQVKGGYSVEIMKRRAFCPISQMDVRPLSDPESVIGQTFAFLITKLEDRGRNIVVSRRDLLERDRDQALEELLAEIKVGDIREGQVSRVAPFGAFIELVPGVEGLVHVSELSWSRVERVEEAISVGERVRVKILEIAKDAKGVRISLSIKAAQADPWNTIAEQVHVGDTVTGKVMRLAPFGAFVEVLPGVEGLIHLSELSYEKRVNKADEIVSVGEVVSVKVKEIDPEKRRISLSLRDVGGSPWDRVDELLTVGSDVPGTVEKRAPFGVFINLAPGITGLLANQVINASPQRKELENLAPGAVVNVRIREIDAANRRVSLLPAGEEGDFETEGDWKKHAPKPEAAPSLGSLGMALQAARDKKDSR